MLGRLRDELRSQILPFAGDIEVLTDNSIKSIGEKRNALLQGASGEYVCFIDDDDWITANYIEHLMTAVESGADCASLMGLYSVDGKTDGVFEHSLKYEKWQTTNNQVKYERYPNHLNLIRSSIAKQFRFPKINFAEDHDWSTQIHKSGLIKTEHHIPEIIYFYRFISNKNHVQPK
jgi:glycosyltransferase involved in cell wall biosynthesis